MITCGEFGGITDVGALCRKPAGHGTGREGYGRCSAHKNNLGLPKFPEAKKNAFLSALVITYGNISRAAAAARMDRGTHYFWLEADPEYKVAFEMAKEIAIDELEMEASRRATSGVLKGIYHQGKLVGYERVSSDVLLITLLNANRPDKFKNMKHDVTVSGTGVLAVPVPLTDEQWGAAAAAQQASLINHPPSAEPVAP